MEILNTKTTTAVVEEATHLGYNVTVRYEIADGETKPRTVTANAVKAPEPGGQTPAAPMGGSISVTVANGNTNTNKPAGTPAQLIDDLEAHCLSLINGEEA